MNKKLILASIFFGFLAIFLTNCKSGEDADTDELAGETLELVDIREEILISMLAPSDMAVMLIDNPDLYFNMDIINPTNNPPIDVNYSWFSYGISPNVMPENCIVVSCFLFWS